MGYEKLKVIDGKSTNWEGLWWHSEYNGFSSAVISLAELRKFKGKVRLYVRKNKYYNGGENNRPNYCFCLKDADADVFHLLEVQDDDSWDDKDSGDNEDSNYAYCDEDGRWYTGNGERLYTRDEARRIIDGAYNDFKYGISDSWDVLPEDYV